MRRSLRLLAVGMVLLGLTIPAFAQGAKGRYEDALARELDLRDSTTSPRVQDARLIVRSLEDVARRHPTSGYSDDALWHAAILAADAFGWHGDQVDAQTAERLLRWLVREYPHSKHAKSAVTKLESLGGSLPPARPLLSSASPGASPSTAAPRPTAQPSAASTSVQTNAAPIATVAAPASAAPVPRAPAGPSVLKAISRSVMGGVERVAIELEGEVTYREERLGAPARLFFDLQQTSVTRDLLNTVQTFDAHAVRQIRLGKHPNGVTRVVLTLDGEAKYSVFTLYNPYRIVVEFPVAEATTAPLATASNGSTPAKGGSAHLAAPSTTIPTTGPSPTGAAASTPVAQAMAPAAHSAPTPLPKTPVPLKPSDIARDAVRGEPALVLPPAEPPVILGSSQAIQSVPLVPVEEAIAPSSAVALPSPAAPTPRLPRPSSAGAVLPEPLTSPMVASPLTTDVAQGKAPSASARTLTPPAVAPLPSTTTPTATAPAAPAANTSGGFSLARQLGLSVSRVVLDPGHGGHDPGALGNGITEASATLDISLRLEKLLTDDGSFEVLMTRRADVYVPLEERTAIANRAQADLFLSIHLNSSRNKSARGFETYYLNFASDPDAEAVAARENSASDQSMRNLPGIVQAIALNNKLDESKDLASLVQRALSRRLRAQSKTAKDLGVKRAPFVVLIGAGMPSVLAEVSFISHAQEMQQLKTASYRQRLAQALFDAIVQYRSTLKSTTTVAQHD